MSQHQQMSFTQLAPAGETTFQSDTPIKGSPAYENQKQLDKLQRIQEQVPHLLRIDNWYIEEHWTNGYESSGRWIEGEKCWRMYHNHTRLVSVPAKDSYKAINKAIELAYFYYLLPLKDLLLIDSTKPRGISTPPSLLHFVRYDYEQAQRWRIEYLQRHPQEASQYEKPT